MAKSRGVFSFLALLVTFVSTFLAIATGMPAAAQSKPEPVPPVEQAPEHVTVVVSPLGEHWLRFHPDIATIAHGGWVSWDVSAVAIPVGGSLVIEFTDAIDDKKGPFPQHPTNPQNPGRGKYKKAHGEGPHLDTSHEDQGKNPEDGFWKYTVTVFNAAGELERFADPGVKITKGPRPGEGKGH
jgi:hypothetical protein